MQMIPDPEKKTLLAAYKVFGAHVQLGLSIEEIGELLTHLGGMVRQGSVEEGGHPEMHEEIADLRIMVDQLAVMYGEEAVEDAYNTKIERLDSRIRDEIEKGHGRGVRDD